MNGLMPKKEFRIRVLQPLMVVGVLIAMSIIVVLSSTM